MLVLSNVLGYPRAYPEGIKIIQPSVDATKERLRWVTRNIYSPNLKGLNQPPVSTVMPQSLAKIIVHTVFSTKDRRPFLRDQNLREELHRYLGGILTNHDCQPLIIGGVEDHVHILSTRKGSEGVRRGQS